MDAKTINKFPIRKYLAGGGIRPAKDRGYYGLYHSPFREDSTPSMKVDYDKNLWIDYGAGEGGTLIDLVMRLERCDAGEAIRLLEQRTERGIDLDTARAHCSEVHYRVADKSYFAVGFQNDAGVGSCATVISKVARRKP